jgi:hypothetical protein
LYFVLENIAVVTTRQARIKCILHRNSNAPEISKNTERNVTKIVLIDASSGTTLSSPFCSSKSYPTVEMPTAGALKHTADEPSPDTDLLFQFKNLPKIRREKYQRQKHNMSYNLPHWK